MLNHAARSARSASQQNQARPADQRSPALAIASTHRLSCLIEFGAASLATKARVECQWRRFHTDWEGRV